MKHKLPKTKAHYRKYADELFRYACVRKWGNIDEIDGEVASDIHHFYPRNSYGHLRYDLDNGIILGRKNHFKHHFKGDPAIHQAIIQKRGKKWHRELQAKAKLRPQSFQTIGWYKQIIKELEEFLTNYPPNRGK